MFNMKELTEKKTGLQLKEVKQIEVNKTYFNGYWSKCYTLLSIRSHAIWGETYTIQWEDGSTVNHSTPFDYKNDFEVIDGL